MKKILLAAGALMSAIILYAQTPSTFAYAFPAAGKTEGPLYVALGVPFYETVKADAFEVDYGIAHALLVTTQVSDETCENVPYTENGFNLPAPLPVGEGEYSNYTVHGTFENYDERVLLALTVYPTYDVEDTVMYHGTLPEGVQEGDNIMVEAQSIHGCDSIVHLYALLCPLTVDADNITYPTVVMDGQFCWMKNNLQSIHYSDGTNIPQALVYNTPMNSNTDENLAQYGRLYTWYSAMHVNEDGSETPEPDAKGFYQGACPTGWHIPSTREITKLFSNPAPAISSVNLWENVSTNTNSTNFDARPAGFYNHQANRFESMGTQTNFWSSTLSNPNALTLMLSYYCNESQLINEPVRNAYSVRCVKNY